MTILTAKGQWKMGVANAHRASEIYSLQRYRECLVLCGESAPGIFNRIFAGDVTWVHLYDHESKQKFLQRFTKRSGATKEVFLGFKGNLTFFFV